MSRENPCNLCHAAGTPDGYCKRALGCDEYGDDKECMIENVDAVRQMLIQKEGGYRGMPGCISAEDMGTHINLVVVFALALRVSGMLDKLLEMMKKGEDGNG